MKNIVKNANLFYIRFVIFTVSPSPDDKAQSVCVNTYFVGQDNDFPF